MGEKRGGGVFLVWGGGGQVGGNPRRPDMKRNCLSCIFSCLFLLLIFPSSANAQDQGKQDQGKGVILPAGTLLRCALNEPNFSSKTADVGTPVVCPLRGFEPRRAC